MGRAPVAVRAARADDWPKIAPLLVDLGRAALIEPGFVARCAPYFALYLTRDDTVALVAEHDSAIVGFLNMELIERISYDLPFARVANVVTASGSRRRSIGELLMRSAEEFARRRNCDSVRLDCGNDRRTARRFYRRLGFRATGVSFTKELAGDSDDPATTG